MYGRIWFHCFTRLLSPFSPLYLLTACLQSQCHCARMQPRSDSTNLTHIQSSSVSSCLQTPPDRLAPYELDLLQGWQPTLSIQVWSRNVAPLLLIVTGPASGSIGEEALRQVDWQWRLINWSGTSWRSRGSIKRWIFLLVFVSSWRRGPLCFPSNSHTSLIITRRSDHHQQQASCKKYKQKRSGLYFLFRNFKVRKVHPSSGLQAACPLLTASC